MGTLIVSDYVLLRKPRLAGVIITGLSTETSLQEQKAKIIFAKVIGSLSPKITMQSGLNPLTISSDPTVVSNYKNDPLVHSQVSAGFGKSSIDTIDWINQHVSEWTPPILIMHGEKDRLSYAEGSREFASKIKGDCTLKIWTGMLHEVHNEAEKEQVFEFLHNWLDNHSNS